MSTLPRHGWLAPCAVVFLLTTGCGDDSAGTGDTATDNSAPDADDAATTASSVELGDRTEPDPSTPTTTSAGEATPDPAPWWPADPRASTSVAQWTVEVIERIDHDPGAFTQGLEVARGVGFESTGRRGESTIRRFDPTTGSVHASVDLDDDYFGEGLTVVGDVVIQLTWQAGTALRWDRETLAAQAPSRYDGEGWGLCARSDGLVLSDGTSHVRIVDPETFEVRRTIEVGLADEPVSLLNELECVDDLVVANVWMSSRVVVFDPSSGAVLAEIDASSLNEEMAPALAADEQNVLNGIAALDDGTLLLSGKLWPTTFRVQLVAT